MMVFKRCAMVSTVESLNWERIMTCMKASVSLSIDAVASSRINILGFLRMALPIQINYTGGVV